MLKDFKPVLSILLRFIIIYMVLLLAYQFFLNSFQKEGLDPFSRMIAEQVRHIQNFMGFPTQLYNDIKGEQVYFYVRNEYPTRMVEGCNAVSVMILFVAFVFAFYKGKKTFIFVILGLILLYIINVLRIVGLNIVVLDYKAYSKTTHDYIFPAVIYGTVVLLWLVWIKFFALKNEKS
ncbi:exosortase family protein XrtF [Chryseobacterium gambrini]|uniref:Exosortase family protein XrtF n=1 Tax=Chryseobacterium gambrini TaxID=373672 RepID=A0AAJ1R231_9FLAO|nr:MULTISPECIES: exosortase family protein XrtF [Chryseobacterium]MDN4012476.1 exosortase family protein XrtF [Chryseobacterium gambrini]MDN4029884.1 exosortase family protein XrtF [Chryseobacterium gambrini]QWA37361.1 exosortase family protein XrtF [Chryseobacterium sp. ZHDP1]